MLTSSDSVVKLCHYISDKSEMLTSSATLTIVLTVIQRQACRKQFDIGVANPFPSPSLPSHSSYLLPSPSFHVCSSRGCRALFPSIPFPSSPLLSPLRSRASLIQLGDLGSTISSTVSLGHSPSGNRIWCILACHMVVPNSLIFLRSN